MEDCTRRKRLWERYLIVFEFLKNHDSTRQLRNRNFLLTNPILLVALGTFFGSDQNRQYIPLAMILFSAFGFFICLNWYSVMKRNRDWLLLTRMELRSIEKALCEFDDELDDDVKIRTFTDAYKIMYKHKSVKFDNIGEKFKPSSSSWSGSRLEGWLSISIGIFWFILLVFGILLAFGVIKLGTLQTASVAYLIL